MFQILIILALSSLSVASADNDDKVSFLLDFLKSQTKPTNLIVWQDCFDNSQRAQLLNGSFISTLFSKQDSLNESDFRENPQHFLFATDLTCTDDAERIILKVNIEQFGFVKFIIGFEPIALQIAAKLFSEPYRWVMFVEMKDDKVLSSIRALPDSDVVIAHRATNDDGFVLEQFYRLGDDSREIHYENYGLWSAQSGIIDERTTKVISRRRSDLKGKTITTSYVVLNPSSMNHLDDYREKEIDSITKVSYILVNLILSELNATRKEIFRNTWGYRDAKTGKWSGMVGDMIEGADIGGLSSKRAKVV